ncbi:MAG: hypothetical protein PHO26_09555 [Dehalococcoidia bacterium]|nr:hypothetical protein [Dehalococcoidia bacterium]MDD5494819.1 hypothetical protein [Dehalococcoidia bacterium]
MNPKHNWYYILLILILTIALTGMLGCKTESVDNKPDTTKISDVALTTAVDNDSKPTDPVKTVFSTNTPAIYCSFKLSDISPEAMIKVSWIYISGENPNLQNAIIDETYSIASGGSSSYYLAIYVDKPASGWYKGDYKVVLSVNNVDKATAPFKIE